MCGSIANSVGRMDIQYLGSWGGEGEREIQIWNIPFLYGGDRGVNLPSPHFLSQFLPPPYFFEPISPSSLNGYVSFSPSSLLFPPISPSSQLFWAISPSSLFCSSPLLYPWVFGSTTPSPHWSWNKKNRAPSPTPHHPHPTPQKRRLALKAAFVALQWRMWPHITLYDKLCNN